LAYGLMHCVNYHRALTAIGRASVFVDAFFFDEGPRESAGRDGGQGKGGSDSAAKKTRGSDRMTTRHIPATWPRTIGFVLFLSLIGALAGCDGDDGAQGSAGPTGPAGPQGPSGPVGSPGGVPVTSADRINVAVESVTIPAGGGNPVVEFKLTNDLTQGLTGLEGARISFTLAQLTPGAGGGSSEWRSYVTRTQSGALQASTEGGSVGTLVDNGDGTYQYTFSKPLAGDGAYGSGPTFGDTKTHRLGLEIRGLALTDGNSPFDFVPAGGDPTFTRLIVDNDTCNACHDQLEFHGEARFDVEYCVTCHNPYSTDGDTGNSVDMKWMIHKIHYGENQFYPYMIVGFGGTVHDFSEVVFPQDIRNCTTCHDESDESTPQASNWRLVANRAICGSCHDQVALLDNSGWAKGNHLGLTLLDDTQCLNCHGPDSPPGFEPVRIPIAHQIPEKVAAEKFRYELVSVTNTAPGQIPVATLRVVDPTNGDAPYDILSDDPANPFRQSSSRLRVNLAWPTVDFNNRGTDNNTAEQGLPHQITFSNGAALQAGVIDNGDGTFSKAAGIPIPDFVTGSGAAIIEGRPIVDADGDGAIDDRLSVVSVGKSFAVTDTSAQDRRKPVNIQKCDDCHNVLSLHGGNRTDNTELCTTCHNPTATCEPGDPAEGPIDFKHFVHAIHTNTYEQCGAFGDRWAHLVYPGKLNNCEGCHNPDRYYPVNSVQSTVQATTVVAGDLTDLSDDVAWSANFAICTGCHTSSTAALHMKQNGADDAAGKTAEGVVVSSGVETCGLCHGPGRVVDVKEVHGVAEFRFN